MWALACAASPPLVPPHCPSTIRPDQITTRKTPYVLLLLLPCLFDPIDIASCQWLVATKTQDCNRSIGKLLRRCLHQHASALLVTWRMLQTYVYNSCDLDGSLCPTNFLFRYGLVLISKKVHTTRPCSGQFRLLDLPLELQLAIFNFAIVKRKTLHLNLDLDWLHCNDPCRSCQWCTPNGLAFPPALARVSRSIRHDVLKIFYGQNKFRVPLRHIDNVGLAEWLGNVGVEYCHLVKMKIDARGPQRGKPDFVPDTMAMLKKAGWEPILGRHRDGENMILTFGEPVGEHIIDAH